MGRKRGSGEAHLDLIWRVVKRSGKELALLAPLLPLLAQLELVELLVGDQRLHRPLVEAALLVRSKRGAW